MEQCPFCLLWVTPKLVHTGTSSVMSCPNCLRFLSAVEDLLKEIRLTQEEQYLKQAFEAEARGDLETRDALLKWAKERGDAARDGQKD